MADEEEDLQQEEDMHADHLDFQIADKEVDLQQTEDLHADPLDSQTAVKEEDLQQEEDLHADPLDSQLAGEEDDLQQEEDLHADPLDSQIADKEVDLQQEEDLHADPLDFHRADEEEDLQQDLEDQMLRVLLMSQLGGQTYMAGEKPAAAVSEAVAAQICQRQAGTGLAAVGGTLQLCQPSVSLIQKWKTRTPNHNNNNNNHNGPGIFESAFAGCPAEEPAVVVVAASRMGRHCCSCG
ncbi:unnamed protein product [Polarella glacialis]|uniref:Uncharacterized protein n=1 Tax=Polarella glacialis TaxID=89957 RepID=A0A813I8U5_POLGL|nr:unnamed protein product [Polarella glacialis]